MGSRVSGQKDMSYSLLCLTSPLADPLLFLNRLEMCQCGRGENIGVDSSYLKTGADTVQAELWQCHVGCLCVYACPGISSLFLSLWW